MTFFDATADSASEPEALCSARDCKADAEFALRWNNPKIHTPERRKVWLACSDHRDKLKNFLELRGFLKDIVPITEIDSRE